MQTQPLGTTGQESSIMTFGAIALSHLEQKAANQMVELCVQKGVNHVDVAPTYGDAESKLSPKLTQHREDLFVGCKTQARDEDSARESLEESLETLGIDKIDLYQFHALETNAGLDELVGPGGALEAFQAAKKDGLIDNIGLTSHASPELILEAMDRIDDLDTVMFPFNPVVVAKGDEEHNYAAVLDRASESDIGTLAIKGFAKRPWANEDVLSPDDRPYATWYEPVETPEEIRDRFAFDVTRGIDTVINPGDPKLVAMVIDAAARFEPLSTDEQQTIIERYTDVVSPVPEQLSH